MRLIKWSVILLISCFSARIAGQTVQPHDSSVTSADKELFRPVFPDTLQKALYRTMLDISKHHLTGFILLKKTSDSSHRFVFTNEFGMKFFDFEISGGKFIVHYCFPSLEKRSLLKILRTDFCILLDFRRELKIKTVKENDDKSGKQVKMTNQYGKWLVSIDNEFHLIKKIESSGKIISRTRVEISSSEIMPTGIVLLNPFIKLSLKMKLLSL